jgi:hypothetical protein
MDRGDSCYRRRSDSYNRDNRHLSLLDFSGSLGGGDSSPSLFSRRALEKLSAPLRHLDSHQRCIGYPSCQESYFPAVVGFLKLLAGVVISGIGMSPVAFLILASIF